MMSFIRNIFSRIFSRHSTEERKERDVENATERAKRKCARFWTLLAWTPFEIEWVEGDRMIGGIPVKYVDRFPRPVGGWYYIGLGKIVIVEFEGRWSVRVIVHEICHFILDKLLKNKRITWHHKKLSRFVYGWPAEQPNQQQLEEKKAGAVVRGLRRACKCPQMRPIERDGIIADCLTEYENKT